jgi:hypothetical protein
MSGVKETWVKVKISNHPKYCTNCDFAILDPDVGMHYCVIYESEFLRRVGNQCKLLKCVACKKNDKRNKTPEQICEKDE